MSGTDRSQHLAYVHWRLLPHACTDRFLHVPREADAERVCLGSLHRVYAHEYIIHTHFVETSGAQKKRKGAAAHIIELEEKKQQLHKSV